MPATTGRPQTRDSGVPMTYRDHPYSKSAHTEHRPLIDLIPDRQDDDLDVSDEDEAFYRDDEYIISPKWQARIAQTSDRVPRKVKRYAAVLLGLLVLCGISWATYFGPRFAEHRALMEAMDCTPMDSYGSNARPGFKDVIQVQDLDAQYQPKHGKRLVIVGDVHGCREELEELLHKVGFKHKHDHLILAGDMISKGPDSPGVISVAHRLGASCVRGNWEDKLLLSLANARQHAASPSTNAITDSLESAHDAANPKLARLGAKLSTAHITFLQSCPVILRAGHLPHLGNLVVVHAGLVPDLALEKQDPYHVMNMRTIDLKTRMPSSSHKGTPWEDFWHHQQMKLSKDKRTTVVYGHNRKKGLNVREYSKGLDSGCVSGGKLSALVVDEEGKTKIVQVKCKRAEGYDED